MTKETKWTCLMCGKAEKPKVFWQRYCSPKCRLLAWAKRKIDEATNEKNS